MLVNDVFPTPPQFVFDCFLFQMLPVTGEQVLFSATHLLSTVNSYLVHSNSTTCHSELHIAGLNGKNVTLEVKNIAVINLVN